MGFVVAVGLSLALEHVCLLVGAPPWVTTLVTFVPMALFAFFAFAFLRRLVRGLPSRERQAVLGRELRPKFAGLPPASGGFQAPTADWPTIPCLSVDRGEVLAVRIPAEVDGTGCCLGCLVFLTGTLFTVLVPFLVTAARGHLQGAPDWTESLVVLPFLLLGIGGIVGTIVLGRRALALARGGVVVLEASGHPLVAGNTYDLSVLPSRPGALHDLRLALVCEEAATYQAGSSSRTDRRKVHDQEVPPASPVGVAQDGSLRAVLDLPATVMHSFDSGKNKITWKIEVRATVGSLNYRRVFPVVVCPSNWQREADA
jgi:hypothetical protein